MFQSSRALSLGEKTTFRFRNKVSLAACSDFSFLVFSAFDFSVFGAMAEAAREGGSEESGGAADAEDGGGGVESERKGEFLEMEEAMKTK